MILSSQSQFFERVTSVEIMVEDEPQRHVSSR
jgi:hypothetical protein